MTMRMTRVVLLVLLLIAFYGCKAASQDQEAAVMITRGNRVWSETSKTFKEWSTEYGNAFAPEHRAKFPANRASLQASADKILEILDEEIRLNNEAIQQYEQAMPLMSNEQHRKGVGLLVSSQKQTLRGYEIVKSQMQLVSDESIVNAKTFEEKFLNFGAQFGRSLRESQAQFEEGSRLLGIELRP